MIGLFGVKRGVPGSARPLALVLLSAMVCTVLMVVACIWYTNHEVSKAKEHAINEVTKSKREWCDLLVTLDVPIPPNPDNPRQVVAAQKLHQLRIRFGC